jgi:hypothetical protein
MAINADKPHLWKGDVNASVDLFNDNPQAEHYVVAPSPVMVPDAHYVPKVGDEAYLYFEPVYKKGERAGEHMDVSVSSDYLAYRAFNKALAAKDREGYRELEDQGKLASVRTGSKVRILEFHEFPADGDIRDAIEVRVLNGPLEGKRVCVLESRVVRLIQKEAPAKAAQAPPPKPAPTEGDDEDKHEPVKLSPQRSNRATTLLTVARNLEKSGKSEGAVAQYRRIMKEFPGSAEAETAAERIRALEKR